MDGTISFHFFENLESNDRSWNAFQIQFVFVRIASYVNHDRISFYFRVCYSYFRNRKYSIDSETSNHAKLSIHDQSIDDRDLFLREEGAFKNTAHFCDEKIDSLSSIWYHTIVVSHLSYLFVSHLIVSIIVRRIYIIAQWKMKRSNDRE